MHYRLRGMDASDRVKETQTIELTERANIETIHDKNVSEVVLTVV